MISAFGISHVVSKRDHKDAKEAAGAAVGGVAGQGAYQQAGYSTKHYVDRHTRKGNPGVTPQQVKLQDKVLKPLKLEHGMHLPNGTPGRNNVGYHRSYPTELPHGRTIRVLGHTHEGRLGVAVGAATTAVAAAGGAAAVHHHVKKNSKEAAVSTSAFGVEHEIAKYDSGTITYHHEQAALHSRKKASGARQVAGGAAIAGAGVAGGIGLHHNAGDIARRMADRSSAPHAAEHAARTARYTSNLKTVARRGGAGLAVGGAALAGVGAARFVHHGRKQNKHVEQAQAARRERNATIAQTSVEKSAFGVDYEISKGAVAATIAPTVGSAASAPKGKKLRTSARTTTAAAGGAVVGATIGHLALRRYGKGALVGGVAGKHAGAVLGYRTSQNFKEQHAAEVAEAAKKKANVEKGVVGEALKMGKEAVGGLKSGFGVANHTPASAAGKLGAQTGQVAVTGAKKLKPLVATPKRALAVGTGTGVLGGAALTHNNGNG